MTNKKQKQTDTHDGTTKRLDAIIRFMMDRQRESDKKITQVEQVLMLHDVGLTDTEIGNIIGYERKNVAAMRTKAKAKKK